MKVEFPGVWYPTMHLQWARLGMGPLPNAPLRLQQQWKRAVVVTETGKRRKIRYERKWRDIPTES